MPEETKLEKVKFKILKALDLSGFTALDPVARLAFGEDPKKQFDSIVRYILIPAAFVLFCLWAWWWIGPRHKTKSGEVPTPDVVMESLIINDTIAQRERVKERDFRIDGAEREAALEKVNTAQAALALEVERLKLEVQKAEAARDAHQASLIAPLDARYDTARAEFEKLQSARAAEIDALAGAVLAGEAGKAALIRAVRADGLATDSERESLKALKTEIDDIRGRKFPPLVEARKRFDSVSDELLFLRSRIDYLADRNLNVKLGEARAELDGVLTDLGAADSPKKALLLAKKAARSEQGIERLESQRYASAATIYQQTRRSLFTVFCGFFMAAFVAIPIGIMCGLNKIFMACMTPIISIFKPVSPVVWLLIFQIVVGAFFPDPETHPFFVTLNSLPFISSLNINPALVFSACTVAMCAVWPALVNTALGVASIDRDYINVARVLRLGFWSRLFRIVIPSALPLIFAGLRISLGVGWMVLIAAEALSSSDGLGKFVWDEYQNGSSLTFANIIMVCFVVGIIGFFLDRMMIICQRLVSFDGAPASV